jgi:hypothetical protein
MRDRNYALLLKLSPGCLPRVVARFSTLLFFGKLPEGIYRFLWWLPSWLDYLSLPRMYPSYSIRCQCPGKPAGVGVFLLLALFLPGRFFKAGSWPREQWQGAERRRPAAAAAHRGNLRPGTEYAAPGPLLVFVFCLGLILRQPIFSGLPYIGSRRGIRGYDDLCLYLYPAGAARTGRVLETCEAKLSRNFLKLASAQLTLLPAAAVLRQDKHRLGAAVLFLTPTGLHLPVPFFRHTTTWNASPGGRRSTTTIRLISPRPAGFAVHSVYQDTARSAWAG